MEIIHKCIPRNVIKSWNILTLSSGCYLNSVIFSGFILRKVIQKRIVKGVVGPLLQLVEPQLFIITRFYQTHYCKAKTDFVLLANKRWLGGESIKSLAKFFWT
jgi:hypothetical protein